MFCFQCQETAGGKGCDKSGVCGKKPNVADAQDNLMKELKILGLYTTALRASGKHTPCETIGRLMCEALFVTITNANFDPVSIEKYIERVQFRSNKVKTKWEISSPLADKLQSGAKAPAINEDAMSLREMIIYGLKGMAAYTHHAVNLGKEDLDIYAFMQRALAACADEATSVEAYLALVKETGDYGVKAMAILDDANTSAYGHPEITKVNIGVGKNPGILISGHDLHDIKQLLEQTEGKGIDVYTHSEMLPAHYYPELKKHKHLVGNYGGAWHTQVSEFETFGGPVFFTSNCIVPPRSGATYAGRVFTGNASGFPEFKHIETDENGRKDFSPLIEMAKSCPPPQEIESGTIVGGFAHNQVFALADKVVDAVKSGSIKHFVVMGGCDGRHSSRSYYTEFAENLPKDAVILTAGCAKYRYNKLNLGDINGIPRVLDAGQCNDSYSLVLIAMKLKEAFGLDDINKLPIVYNIAWYEQKAVIVLLALLSLGIKNIKLGPTLPGFLSAGVVNVLVNSFGIAGIGEAKDDVVQFIA